MSTQLDSVETGTRKKESSPPLWIITNTSRYSTAFFLWVIPKPPNSPSFPAKEVKVLHCFPIFPTCDPPGSNPTNTHMHTHRPLLSFESTKVCLCVCVTQDLHWNIKVRRGRTVCILRDERERQQRFSAAAWWRQVPADQPKAQECDSSYDGRAELRALIPDWRESRIFRHSEWRTRGKGWGWEKPGQRDCVSARDGEERGKAGGHGSTHSHFSTPLFEPPNPKSFLSWQLPARKLFSQRDEGCEGLRLVCSLSGGFTGSTVPETKGDRFPDKWRTTVVTWHN